MKNLCLILSCFVLLLSAKPCCTDNCKVPNIVNKTPGKAPNEKGCSGCSPFFTCGSCAGFVVAKPTIYAVLCVPETPVTHFGFYQHPYIEDVTLAIWQPPQLS